MNINELSKEELLALKSDINSRIKRIDKIKKEINTKDKNILRDLIDCDNPKIFCLEFNGSCDVCVDYVDITFSDIQNSDSIRYQFKSTNSGFSGIILLNILDSHCFIADCGYNDIYFLTLKPENWRSDIIFERDKLISEKEKQFSDIVAGYKKTITGLLESDKVDIFLENFKKLIR